MESIYLVTGANGHLGSAVLRLLQQRGLAAAGLLLPGESAPPVPAVSYFYGNVLEPESLRPFFELARGRDAKVIHTAGIVDITGKLSPMMKSVNVQGTKNLLALCREYAVTRLIYVSSVHAIPEGDPMRVITEADHFSPDAVVGGYAKTKAEATQTVLDWAKEGFPAIVVHPSGILGPYDRATNHSVQLIREYLAGKLPACVKGGYDFVDVRDVAQGCLSAAERGRIGECYILSNRHYEIRELLAMVRRQSGGRALLQLPMWMAKAAAPLLGLWAKWRKELPLYTRYSLYTLSSNDRFDHSKATAELNYRPRDLMSTVQDTVAWIRSSKRAGAER